MKKSNLNENNFEVSHVIKTLVDNGYVERLPENYNQELILDTVSILWGQTPKLTFRKRAAYAAGSGKPH